MASNILKVDSDRLQYTAGADIASGAIVVLGNGMIGVALAAIANGATGDVLVRGVIRATKSNAAAWAIGDEVFWDTANSVMVKTPTADTVPAGIAYDAALQAATVGYVALNLRGYGVAVANAAGANPTQAEYNALLTSLRNAGLIDVS